MPQFHMLGLLLETMNNIEKNKDVQKKNMSNPKNKDNTSQTNTDELQKTVEELKQKLKDVEDKLLRSLAENDNLRKRHEKETEDNLKYATKNFALSFINSSILFLIIFSAVSISSASISTRPSINQ